MMNPVWYYVWYYMAMAACCVSSFEMKIYQQWVAGVDEACSFNLAQPLIVRNEETNFIAVNFDPQVTHSPPTVTSVHFYW